MNKSKEQIRDEAIDKKWPLDGKKHQQTRNKLAKVSSWGVEYEMMDTYARQMSIAFFGWYGVKMVTFIEYITKVKPLVESHEIEEKMKEFEGKTFDELYDIFLAQYNKEGQ